MGIGDRRIVRTALSVLLLAGLVPAGLTVAAPAYAAAPATRTDAVLDTDAWRFHLGDVSGAQSPGFDDSSWTPATLPHTWNNRDGEAGGGNYLRGVGWYRTHQAVASSLAGRRPFLQFDGADTVPDV